MSGLRVRTSVTLPSALRAEIDKLDTNRSAFLERAATSHMAKLSKAKLSKAKLPNAKRDARDLEIINRCAEQQNCEVAEVAEVLEIQDRQF